MRRMIPNPLIKTIVDLKTANELEAKVYEDLVVAESANIASAKIQFKTDGVSCVSICGEVTISNTSIAALTITGLPNISCDLSVFPATNSLGGGEYITITQEGDSEHRITFNAGQVRTIYFNALICNSTVAEI